MRHGLGRGVACGTDDDRLVSQCSFAFGREVRACRPPCAAHVGSYTRDAGAEWCARGGGAAYMCASESGRSAGVTAVSRATGVRSRRAACVVRERHTRSHVIAGRRRRYMRSHAHGVMRERRRARGCSEQGVDRCVENVRKVWVYFWLIYSVSRLDMRSESGTRGRMRSAGRRKRYMCSHALGGIR